jgi:Putative zinc-finger
MNDIADIECIELVELVTEYFDAALPAADRARFEHHVAKCPGCLEIIEQFRVVVATTGALRPDDVTAVGSELRERMLVLFRDWQVTGT